jgi:hypothetical protein
MGAAVARRAECTMITLKLTMEAVVMMEYRSLQSLNTSS